MKIISNCDCGNESNFPKRDEEKITATERVTVNPNAYQRENGNTPVIPLPNPGEGGPVYGPNGPNSDDMSNIPVIPLPNPGEGGPVYGPTGPNSDDMSNIPVIPLPNPGEGGPVYGPTGPNSNIYPLPSIPSTGLIPSIIGTIISTHPRPNSPCIFCNSVSSQNGNVRFLNAASGYNPFSVFINQNLLVNPLDFSEVTEYETVAGGEQIVTIMGENGYIYIQKPVNVVRGTDMTIAIINTQSGLDLLEIMDETCNRSANMSCIRVGNLSYNSGPLNVIIGNQYINFSNVQYKEVTEFMTIWPGQYTYSVTKSSYSQYQNYGSNALLSSNINMQRNKNYSIYIFNWNKTSPDTIKAIVIEE